MPLKFKPFQIERPWGYFRQFSENMSSTVKIISVKPNEILSLQSHARREEFWHVISGHGIARIGDDKKEINIGDELFVDVGVKHQLAAGILGLEVLEIGYGDFAESDIIHYEDKYGRK